jgi:hypothetical protein
MTSAHPTPRSAQPVEEPADDETDEALGEDEAEAEAEADELEATDELSEETGIDLTDASDLDADNVPADEEFDRVMQAPD